MIKRRDFMIAAAAGSAATLSGIQGAPAQDRSEATPALGSKSGDFALALGGGAAKAFAHIPILEAMDELGVQPAVMSGTSMGAILGAFYSSGMTGGEIREYALDLLTQKTELFRKLFLSDGKTWSSLLDLGRPSIIDPVVLFETIFPDMLAQNFADLRIPMKIIATDFYNQSQVTLTEGPLLPAIAASSALPMLLTPVQINRRILIDGGFVNPTPFDVLRDTGYLTVGVDVTGSEYSEQQDLPSGMETWIGSFSITLHSLVAAKLAVSQPDLLIEPAIGGFSTMDFFKIEDILEAAAPSKDEFKRGLTLLLDAR
ncbi:MAG: patatin-like phospholipase family protein [Roseibium sp.]|uniref:patatin-like phospholipase family protein n=1 Tax=Roseibium sp. TaxID=1936156 RepID=UPI0026353052|nr:patatin-like phospholipase family protein [Roseibium sp.]MCV0425246.1 patatin-like phospholipase family protein [Roseibium sp.]